MYRNDDSNVPLWTLGFCPSKGTPTSDGQSLIVRGYGLNGNLGSDMAHIYLANGRHLRIDEVDIVPRAELYLRHYLGFHSDSFEMDQLDESTGRLVIRSDVGDVAEFSLADGRKLSGNSWPTTLRIISGTRRGMIALGTIGALLFFMVWRVIAWWRRNVRWKDKP
jgi:hypothetical protein